MKRKFVTLLALGLLLLQPIFAESEWKRVSEYKSPHAMLVQKMYVEDNTWIRFAISLGEGGIVFFNVPWVKDFFFTDDEMKTILKKLNLKIYDIPNKYLEPETLSAFMDQIVYDITKKSHPLSFWRFELDDIKLDDDTKIYSYWLREQ